MPVTEYKYNDGMEHGSRVPRLYLLKGDNAVKFCGAPIDGYCAIASSHFQKNGKWSNTTYTLFLASGVRPIYMISEMHGTWGENFQQWSQIAESWGVSIETAKNVVNAEYKTTAARLDAVESFLMSQEASDNGIEVEEVVVSFGGPSNRAMEEGYWETPKSRFASNGVEVVVVPDPVSGWSDAVCMSPVGASIVSVKKTRGYHGGYVAVTVLVPLVDPVPVEESPVPKDCLTHAMSFPNPSTEDPSLACEWCCIPPYPGYGKN